MLADRLTAEAGGLGRRRFDHSGVSSEISFTLPLSISTSFLPSIPLFSPPSPLLVNCVRSGHPCCSPQGSRTEGGSVTQRRRVCAARGASQEKERWRGREGGREAGRQGIRTAHELHASAQMTPGISNPWPLLV